MRTFKKSDLHFIGHLRGIDQYEVQSDLSILILKLNDKYYYSECKDLKKYNDMILSRITLAYKGSPIDTTCLGEEIIVEWKK